MKQLREILSNAIFGKSYNTLGTPAKSEVVKTEIEILKLHNESILKAIDKFSKIAFAQAIKFYKSK